jgi:hypothetical protein
MEESAKREVRAARGLCVFDEPYTGAPGPGWVQPPAPKPEPEPLVVELWTDVLGKVAHWTAVGKALEGTACGQDRWEEKLYSKPGPDTVVCVICDAVEKARRSGGDFDIDKVRHEAYVSALARKRRDTA